MKRRVAVCALALLVSACSSSAGEGTSVSSSPSTASEEPSDGAIRNSFDVGGNELFLDCTGASTGAPTVIMLHGIIWESTSLAGWADWNGTRSALGTRTCAYDRRNVGQSGQVPGMSSSTDAVEDLHALLNAAGVEPPYVLAGYSFGGILTLLYAGTYPDEVAGIVLVDGTLPLEWELDPPETIEATIVELNSNAERIDFYGAGDVTAMVLDRLPHVPITYLRALQAEDDPDWEKGAYAEALRSFMRSLPSGRLLEYDTNHDMLINIPDDVADQIRKVVAQAAA